MDLSTITVSDFKTHFARDFPYLPVWLNTSLYLTGDVVYYSTTQMFYKAKQNVTVAGTLPTDTTYWSLTAESTDNYVLDSDITKAFSEAKAGLNQSLYPNDETIKLSYLYLTAHYLCIDTKNMLAGINSAANFPVSSRTVGSVAEGYAVPTHYTSNPILAFYTQTGYGNKYLSLTLPAITGNVGVVAGWTQP